MSHATTGDASVEPLLSLRDVHAGYGSATVLDGVDLEVKPGEVVALLGANGAGKTTLLRVVTGLLAPRSGSVRFQGRDISSMSAHRVARLGMSQVPEGRGIFPGLSVQENLDLAGFARSRKTRSDMFDSDSLFPILQERTGQRGGTLSGGEQQMLAVARALATRPSLLILDEPSLGMAPLVVQGLFAALERVKASNVSMLIAEQAAHQAITIADRVYVLGAGGRVLSHGPSADYADSQAIFESYMT